MQFFKTHLITKSTAIILAFLLLNGNLPLGSQNSKEEKFSQAVHLYFQQQYDDAISHLEEIENSLIQDEYTLKAKTYLLFSACYEKKEKKNLAKAFFSKIEFMLEEGLINKFPEIQGIDSELTKIYNPDTESGKFQNEGIEKEDQETDQYHFEFKEPKPVSPVDEKEVIQYEGRKNKKRGFPWIPVIVGVIIIGVAIYFYFNKKKNEIEVNIPEIEWVYIPAGEFNMGDNFNEGNADEQPVHSVYLDAYYISKYEISVRQYDSFCLATGRMLLSDSQNLNVYMQQCSAWNISWENANAFCQWLSQETGENIQLPTEAQWERAARGLVQNRYPWGNSPPDCDKANYQGCGSFVSYPDDNGAGNTPSGIFNMAGNVWEWCQDWYSPTYYSQSSYQNPTGPASGSYRVIRGGAWNSSEIEIRSANRDFKAPETLGPIGIRLIKRIN